MKGGDPWIGSDFAKEVFVRKEATVAESTDIRIKNKNIKKKSKKDKKKKSKKEKKKNKKNLKYFKKEYKGLGIHSCKGPGIRATIKDFYRCERSIA